MKHMKDFEWELLKEMDSLSDADIEELLACCFAYKLYADDHSRLAFLKDKFPRVEVNGELASKNSSRRRMRMG